MLLAFIAVAAGESCYPGRWTCNPPQKCVKHGAGWQCTPKPNPPSPPTIFIRQLGQTCPTSQYQCDKSKRLKCSGGKCKKLDLNEGFACDNTLLFCTSDLLCKQGKCTYVGAIPAGEVCNGKKRCVDGHYCAGCSTDDGELRCVPKPVKVSFGRGDGCHPKYANWCACGLMCKKSGKSNICLPW